jgi:hypothetical protein
MVQRTRKLKSSPLVSGGLSNVLPPGNPVDPVPTNLPNSSSTANLSPSAASPAVIEALNAIKAQLERIVLHPVFSPPLAPVDPLTVFQRVAEDLKAAEDAFAQKKLVITSATAEVEFDIKGQERIGAHATIKLQVSPKS